MFITAAASFTRPANPTQYAGNELVANSATAVDVVPMKFAVDRGVGHGQVLRARVFSDNQAVTAANFNLHLFSRSPVPTNGDNGAFAVDTAEWFLGTVACDLSSGAFTTTTDKAKGFAITGGIGFDLKTEGVAGSEAIFGLIETAAAATYTPASGEVFKVVLEIEI